MDLSTLQDYWKQNRRIMNKKSSSWHSNVGNRMFPDLRLVILDFLLESCATLLENNSTIIDFMFVFKFRIKFWKQNIKHENFDHLCDDELKVNHFCIRISTIFSSNWIIFGEKLVCNSRCLLYVWNNFS